MSNDKKNEIKWRSLINPSEKLKWIKSYMYKIPYCCTKDSKLIWFQYRILYRILGTKQFLVKCKIKDNPQCSFCKSDEESIEHLFFYCPYISSLWKDIENWINSKCDSSYKFTLIDTLFGIPGKQNNCLNLIIIVVKYLIFSYSQKENIPTLNNVQHFLKHYYLTENISYQLALQENKFRNKWRNFDKLFEL